jgi:hypothetical protein
MPVEGPPALRPTRTFAQDSIEAAPGAPTPQGKGSGEQLAPQIRSRRAASSQMFQAVSCSLSYGTSSFHRLGIDGIDIFVGPGTTRRFQRYSWACAAGPWKDTAPRSSSMLSLWHKCPWRCPRSHDAQVLVLVQGACQAPDTQHHGQGLDEELLATQREKHQLPT